MSQIHEPQRRVFWRHRVAFPVQIDTEDRSCRIGITRDLSRTGALVFTNSKYAIGERMRLMLSISQSIVRAIDAAVVRVEPTGAEIIWRFALGLQFDETLPGTGDALAFPAARA